MGTDIESWDAFMEAVAAGEAGAYYVGHGGGEWLWLILSIAACGLALFMGLAHEKMAYRKAAKK